MICLDDLLAATGGRLMGSSGAQQFTGFAFDSRRVKPGELFLAVVTDTGDGHAFCGEAIGAGAAGVLGQRLPSADPALHVPHILVVRTKTQLLFDNSDNALHNVHGYKESLLQTAFNVGSPALSKAVESNEAYLSDAAKYIVKCDIHPWMNAYIFAVTNPYYAVTDAKGQYSIDGVPPGTYQLEAWHEGMTEEPKSSSLPSSEIILCQAEDGSQGVTE